MRFKLSYEIRDKYLRKDMLPTIFCPGCGIGTVLQYTLRAIDELGWSKDEVVWVSGIGCSSRVPGFVDFDGLHTTHGRALAFATGIKMARPDLKVIAFMGDGDTAAIGGNHFIHAIRRNLDVTVILINNFTYGMTGGQVAPTTLKGLRGTTAPYGSFENPFDIAELAVAAGANYVARWTVFNYIQGINSIKKALQKKGFSLVEFLSPCPISFGRRNRMKTAPELIKWYNKITVPISKAKNMSPEELEGKIVIGEFVDRDRPSLDEEYEAYKKRAKKMMGWEE
ncbi:2-oxoacid:ferredoxin oxidoreductase subunit beta [Thermococcus sp. M39]|uniref:2-oxoacid:ferredoxin oxidoreductase subunit beta n=1 Tax=unclassified Thermococcus TaxID=2627626 RepID=UPI00143ABFE9|nr:MULTISPECIES: 2-oxoacid:ferredoxin oxidoreductase subunit beta [unclassified Thermococcus]NJE08774.1 2-oxoacid:ferredoxin oxidoreductase subunit beta [Thermococcus sp. M39]NJE12007.1 2-oxoacid:ferredoxin oxidoreductase subunit beta [Thermococcus sp. LS2]